jgi:hypothetical protein
MLAGTRIDRMTVASTRTATADDQLLHFGHVGRAKTPKTATMIEAAR